MVATLREALGPGPRLRLDVNSNWSVPQALRMLERLAEYDIDFVEQPVRETPIGQLGEVRRRSPIAVCANEGLWSEADAYARICAREADVFCFSPSWVGSLGAFSRLAHVAELEGLKVCKHTHGELGIAAAACQHVLLTLPNAVEGNQQTAQMMVHDVLSEELPIAHGPHWGRIDGAGLGVEVDAERRRRGCRALPQRGPVPAVAGLPAGTGGAGVSGRLEGKAALVVGGGSGMGRAGAVAMANEGARVAVADIDLERAEAVAASCGGVAVAVDVCDTGSVERMVATTVERFGRLDAVYHCAVDVPFVNTQDRRLTELGEDVWDRMIDLVLTGTFRVVKYAGRQMLTQGSGSIILSSTVDALVGCAGLDSYTAAKGGVTALTRSLAAGLAPDGIRVNAIAPSFVSSEPQKVWLEDDASRTTIEQLHLLEIPTPEEIAPLVVYLASDESRRMTGAVIPLDSGYMAFKARLDVMGAMQANS